MKRQNNVCKIILQLRHMDAITKDNIQREKQTKRKATYRDLA